MNFKKIESILSVSFAILLAVPLVGLVFSPNSSIAKPDISSPSKLFNSLGLFKYEFGENYLFRDELIKINGMIKIGLFRNSPTGKVLIGYDDWLYLADEQILDNHRNIYSFTKEKRDLWSLVLEKRKQHSDAVGAFYCFMLSPDKPNIYPEYLPEKYNIVGTISRKDELFSLMERFGILYSDFYTELISKKSELPLYYRTDTHWNEIGAYYSYRKIISDLSKATPFRLEPLIIKEFKKAETHGGDLARLMGVEEIYRDYLYSPDFSFNATTENEEKLSLQMIDVQHSGQLITKCKSGEIECGVVFHDSFGVALIPYLAEHFKTVVFIRTNDYLPEIVERYSPDIVIQQLVERRLLNWMPNENEI